MATLSTAAGDNPERLRSEAAFASLCRAAHVPASSDKTVRHRLNRDGNRAPQTVAVVRTRWGERTRAYVRRRSAEGETKPEKIIRCLKRYICREVYRILALPPREKASARRPRISAALLRRVRPNV